MRLTSARVKLTCARCGYPVGNGLPGRIQALCVCLSIKQEVPA